MKLEVDTNTEYSQTSLAKSCVLEHISNINRPENI